MITPKGYVRLWHRGRAVLEHRLVWEREHGPVPEGLQLHHVNGDKADNRLANLQLVDATTHKRLHSGCELRDGVWWKPCKACGELKALTPDHWYIGRSGRPNPSNICRPCQVSRVVERKRRRA